MGGFNRDKYKALKTSKAGRVDARVVWARREQPIVKLDHDEQARNEDCIKSFFRRRRRD